MSQKSIITASAEGQNCALKIYPYCDGGTSTVVYCHMPCPDKGTGIKGPDWWGSYGCLICHAIIDGRYRVKDLSSEDILKCQWLGVYRTQKILIESGLLILGV